MSRLKVIMNKKIENETQERKEIGWDNRFNMPSKSPNAFKINQIKRDYLSNAKNLHEDETSNLKNYYFLEGRIDLSSKVNMKNNTLAPKIRGKSNYSINKKLNSEQSFIEKKIQSSSKNRITSDYSYNTGKKRILSLNHNDFSNLKDSRQDEKLLAIRNLWNETGVTDLFRNIFEGIASRLDQNYRNGYYDHELAQLNLFKEKIQKLTSEIHAREKSIELLRNLDKIISSEKDKKKVIQDTIKTLQHLRVLSINIVNHYVKMRQISSYAVLNGKYDIERMSCSNASGISNLLMDEFDNNYLLKMKNDLDFLSNSNFKKSFKFLNSDPFLIGLSNELDTAEVNKFIRLPIEDEMMNSIRNCQYIMLDEFAYYEVTGYVAENKTDITVTTDKSQLSGKKLISAKTDSSYIKKELRLNPLHLKSNKVKINGDLSPLNPSSIKSRIDSETSNRINKNEQSLIKNKTKDKYVNLSICENDLKNIDKIAHSVKNVELRPISSKKHIPFEINTTTNNTDVSYDQRSKIRKQEKIIIEDTSPIRKKEKPYIGKISDNTKNIHSDIMKEVKEIIDSTEDLLKVKNNNFDDNDTLGLLKRMDEALKNSYDDSLISIKEKVNLNIDQPEVKPLQEEVISDTFEINNIKCEYFNGDIFDFTQEYESYVTKICDEQKVTFKIKQDICQYFKGNFPKLIKMLNKGKSLIGLAVVVYDAQNESTIRLSLSHFSTIYYENYLDIISLLIKFIQATSHFDELLVELYHGLKNESFQLNDYIKNIVKDKLGFKWVTLENTGTERLTKYKYINKDTNNNKNFNKNNLEIKNLVALQLLENVENAENKTTNVADRNILAKENQMNLFPVTCILGDMIYNFDFQIKNKLFKLNVDKLKKYTKKIINVTGNNFEEIINFINENVINPEEINQKISEYFSKSPNKLLFSSVMNVHFNFENFNSFKKSDYIYNTIESEIDVLKNVETSQNYYLIRCLNENYTILIGNIERSYNLTDKNIFSYFLEVYSKIDQNPVGTKKSISLPAFSIKQNEHFLNPALMKDMQIYLEDTLQNGSSIYFNNEYSFTANNHKESILKFKKEINEDEVVLDLENSFIFAVINLEVLQEISIPAISVCLVNENNFVKY